MDGRERLKKVQKMHDRKDAESKVAQDTKIEE